MSKELSSIAFVIPVRNEAVALIGLLESFSRLSGLDNIRSIVFVDGLSEDGSMDVVHEWQERLPGLIILSNPQKITPVAFNLGIKYCLAQGADAVVLLSAHSWLREDFLDILSSALQNDAGDIIGGVHFYPEPKHGIESAIQVFSESRLGRRLKYFSNIKTVISTGVAFCPTIRRHVFEKISMFDEKLIRNQDNDFTSRAIKNGLRVVTHPELRYGYRTRDTFGGLARQMYNNGYWVGRKVWIYGFKHLAPFLFYMIFVLSLLIGVIFGRFELSLFVFIPYLAGILLETFVSVRALGKNAIYLFPLFFIGHLYYSVGTGFGLVSTVLNKSEIA